jgi:hypothetical protein
VGHEQLNTGNPNRRRLSGDGRELPAPQVQLDHNLGTELASLNSSVKDEIVA